MPMTAGNACFLNAVIYAFAETVKNDIFPNQ